MWSTVRLHCFISARRSRSITSTSFIASITTKSEISQNYKRLLTTLKYDDVTQRNNISSSKGLSEISSDISDEINRLQHAFKESRRVNIDAILSDLELIHIKQRIVPLSFYFDSIRICAGRHDVLRTELLLRLASENIRSASATSYKIADNEPLLASRSRPMHDPFDKLVSFAVSELMCHGSVESSLTLWVRMSSSGHITSKVSLEKLLDKKFTLPACRLQQI
jgi:hypothetical protein